MTMKDVAEHREMLWLLPAAPGVWALHFMASYITAAIWCGKVAGPSAPLTTARSAIALYTLAALAVIGFIAYVGYRRQHSESVTPEHDDDTPHDRHWFIGFSTLLLAGMSAIAVCYAAMTLFFIEGCQ
jgi:hypothetical protein